METIYVSLLDEGIMCWRPVKAEKIDKDTYKIVSVNEASDDEVWQFNVGDVVRIENRTLSGMPAIVAMEQLHAKAP